MTPSPENRENHVQIPVIQRPTNGLLHHPTPADPESGIINAIRNRGIPVVTFGEYNLVQVESVSWHHPTKPSTVLWMVQQSRKEHIAPWSRASWDEFADNEGFWNSTEGYFREVKEIRPRQRIILYIGFIFPQKPDAHKHGRGLQTQDRGHFHDTAPIDEQTPYDRILDPAQEHDAFLAQLFLNTASARSTAIFSEELKEYGHRLKFTQPVGLDLDMLIERSIHGFGSLQEAVLKSLQLQQTVADRWLDHVRMVSGTDHSPIFPDIDIPCKQCAVPSFAITMPNSDDRQTGNTGDSYPVWAMPFSIAAVQSILSPRGVIFDGNKPIEAKPL